MEKNLFFNPTALYKEFIILDSIEYDPRITQRELAFLIQGSVSMVNQYLDTCEQKGYITKDYLSKKNVVYSITTKGKERKRVLNIRYLSEIQRRYKVAKKDTTLFLEKIAEKGFKSIIFYGAGEVAEILLQTINDDNSIPINIIGVIDDDINKQGGLIVNYKIQDLNTVIKKEHDAILIASYTNYHEIFNKLIDMDYSKEKILNFFE